MDSIAALKSPTVRETVKLPSMPKETIASVIHPPIEMARGYLDGENLRFITKGGFDQALRQGFFLLKTPESYSNEPGDRFVSHFFQSTKGDVLDTYRGFKDVDIPGDYQGYFDRPNDQWENFYIEKSNWDKLPSDVAYMGQEMCIIGIRVLRSVLEQIGIPRTYWAQLTSGLSNFQGHQMLGFNHFRAEKNMRGSKFHRDSGWLTMLRTTSPGLLAYIDQKLYSVNPEPDYFIVNFGSSIEILTEKMQTVAHASIHGVVQTERHSAQQERVSYVAFLDSALNGTIFRWEPDGPIALQSVLEFAVQEVERTYDNNNETL